MFDIAISFIFLSFLEIILGIDNLIVISLITNKVSKEYQQKARVIGLFLSLIFRLVLLCFIGFLLSFTNPLFSIYSIEFSTKDIIMFVGGLFLIYKGFESLIQEVSIKKQQESKLYNHSFFNAILQIILIDFVFSLDSLISAIGLTNNLYVIASAIIVSIIFMLFFAPFIASFIAKYHSLKIIALAFIFLIGIFLCLEGLHIYINKNYLYFALCFTLFVEFINIKSKKSI